MTDFSNVHGDGASTLAGWRGFRGSGDRLRDLLTRFAVSLWFFVQAINFVREIAATLMVTSVLELDKPTAARLLSRLCLFLFFTLISWLTLVRARPSAQAPGVQPRVSALLGAYLMYFLPFLPERADLGIGWTLASSMLIVCGNVLALAILLRLGRSFSIMAEARKLVVTGPYAVIRHPLYLAEQIALVGAFIQFASLPAALLISTQFLFQVQRMRNEEAVLRRSFPDYEDYMARTARLIPGIW